MPNVVDYGYLDLPYLEGEPYLTGVMGHGVQSQVTLVIADEHNVRSQTARTVANFPHTVFSQTNRVVKDFTHNVRSQTDQEVTALHPVRSQVARETTVSHHVPSQIESERLNFPHAVRSQINRGKNPHLDTHLYLVNDYLEEPYLTPYMRVTVRSQVYRMVTQLHKVKSQVARFIDDFKHPVHSQTRRRIDALHNVRSQITRLQGHVIHSQVAQVLYNITNLRIMMDFPSRGVSGNNWTSNSTLAGNFSVLNLNTDIVEQVWRSNNMLSGIQLVCDSEVPQGVFTDTLSFQNHNLTTSASCVWQQSNDPGFSSTFDTVFSMTTTNFYWIAPTLPLTGYRYNRFLISDPTNPNPYLQIGTIVFGSSIIFQGECFVDQVSKRTKHYSDKVLTEAFTNVSNDRAVKYSVSLEFKSLDFNKGNYRNIRAVFDYARTSLKCLWIPTPKYASRFATFAKLVEIPEELHNCKGERADYVDFTITTDESQ